MNAVDCGVTSLGQIGWQPALSFNDTAIAFTRDYPEVNPLAIHILNGDGSGVSQVTEGGARLTKENAEFCDWQNRSPAWYPRPHP